MQSVSAPEVGQLVQVRQRQFVVSDVRAASGVEDVTTPEQEGRQHLVSLQSIEKDALGEELQVIWELEPGARVFEKAPLPEPEGFDPPDHFDAFLDAVRWGAASHADTSELLAPFRSGIDIEDYQLEPLVRALQMPRANLLIADDVGLGKTIEAGLIAQELILRHRARRLLVVCPASLQIHWKEQMRDKFGLDFRIVDSDLMKQLRRERGIHVNPWTHFPRLITSIDYLKRDRQMRLFRDALPGPGEPMYPRRFDLLIVDEAHNVAPSGSGQYATDSLRTRAIRELSPHFEHRLFLTATPHNGYRESFTALLELVDNQRFARGVEPDERQLREVMVRRLKTDFPAEFDGSRKFPKRELHPLAVDYTDEERAIHKKLRQYSDLRRKRARDSRETFAVEFVLKLLKKRLFSSPEAFRSTLEKHIDTVYSIDEGEEDTSDVSEGVLRQLAAGLDEGHEDDEAFEEETQEVVGNVTRTMSMPSDAEGELLDEMRDWANYAANRADSKCSRLTDWLHDNLKEEGDWTDKRVIIFTEYRATQDWLLTRLNASRLAQDGRVELIYGGMDVDERERIKNAFQARPGPDNPLRILLATDAASEGIDLQRHCSRVIHYEIPWNPNRLEQRNGRVDRHGQQADQVDIFHFVGREVEDLQDMSAVGDVGELEGDLEFLARAAWKVDQIREDLGSVGPVIAEQVEEAMHGRRSGLDTRHVEEEASSVRDVLSFERDLRKTCEELKEQYYETRREQRLHPDNVHEVIEIGLELAGQPALEPTDLIGVWPDQNDRRMTSPVFEVPPLSGDWAKALEGLTHPHTGDQRPVTFDPDIARGRDDVVLVHLNHPLAQKSLRLLRAEVWADEARRSIHRVTGRVIPTEVSEHPLIVAHGRLVVIGGNAHRLHEEVMQAGLRLLPGPKVERLNVGETAEALEHQTDRDVPESMEERFREVWPRVKDPLFNALTARVQSNAKSLANKLEAREKQEKQDISEVLNELRAKIESELEEKEAGQLFIDGMKPEEQEQFERNISAIRKRLEQIPREIDREQEQIEARFEDPESRLFPVAVTFLVPSKMVH